MLYDTTSDFDRRKLLAIVMHDVSAKSGIVEYTRKRKRSLKQNSYLHLILGCLAMEIGESLEYVKVQYFKLHCNRHLFVAKHDDDLLGSVNVLRSSKDLSQEEMSEAIDRFKKFAAENGYLLPDADDLKALQEIELQMSRCSKYGL